MLNRMVYIYAINKLPCQLPYSHDIRVYGFDGGCPGIAYAPRALRKIPLLVGLVKCSHAAKKLAARERHFDIPWKCPEIGSRMVLSFYFCPCTMRQRL